MNPIHPRFGAMQCGCPHARALHAPDAVAGVQGATN